MGNDLGCARGEQGTKAQRAHEQYHASAPLDAAETNGVVVDDGAMEATTGPVLSSCPGQGPGEGAVAPIDASAEIRTEGGETHLADPSKENSAQLFAANENGAELGSANETVVVPSDLASQEAVCQSSTSVTATVLGSAPSSDESLPPLPVAVLALSENVVVSSCHSLDVGEGSSCVDLAAADDTHGDIAQHSTVVRHGEVTLGDGYVYVDCAASMPETMAITSKVEAATSNVEAVPLKVPDESSQKDGVTEVDTDGYDLAAQSPMEESMADAVLAVVDRSLALSSSREELVPEGGSAWKPHNHAKENGSSSITAAED